MKMKKKIDKTRHVRGGESSRNDKTQTVKRMWVLTGGRARGEKGAMEPDVRSSGQK